MFSGCTDLSSINLSSFDTSNVTQMDTMFNRMESITSLDLSHFNTSNLSTFKDMFGYTTTPSLSTINLNGWDISNISGYGPWGAVNNSLIVYCDQGGSPGTGTFFDGIVTKILVTPQSDSVVELSEIPSNLNIMEQL